MSHKHTIELTTAELQMIVTMLKIARERDETLTNTQREQNNLIKTMENIVQNL